MNSVGESIVNIFEKRTTNSNQTLDPLCAVLVDKIFVKMALICRGFDSFYADRNRLNAEKTQWIIAFTKLGLKNQSQIQSSLDSLALHRFPNPPQLGEFLEWRNGDPQKLGFPSVEEAYQLSLKINRQFSNYRHEDERIDAVIRHVIAQIDSMTYRSMPTSKSRDVFEHFYNIALRQFMGGNLDVINKAIEDKSIEPTEVKKQQAVVNPEFKEIKDFKSAIGKMKQILGKT